MLVLTRKAGQKITIADNITIEVLEVAGGRVRIGIEAPKDVPIRRNELAGEAAPEADGDAASAGRGQ